MPPDPRWKAEDKVVENSSDVCVCTGREREKEEKKETSLVSVRCQSTCPGLLHRLRWFVEVEAGMCSDRLMEKPRAGSADPLAFF